jgi:ketosteroid isomerase-like protein
MRILAVCFLALFADSLAAQTTSDDQAVLAVVQRTFDAMRGRDTSAFRSVFAPGARIVSTFTDREGKPAMRTIEIDRFVAAIAGFQEEVVERIFEPKVHVVDNLATVWAEYDLHAGGKFSHCGVDAFHLGRTEAGWKIIHITDTQRREGCPTRPPL